MAEAIVKWGNSRAVRLSLPHLRRAKLSENDPITITSEAGCITIRAARPKVVLADLLAQIPDGETFPLVDYGRAVGNEIQ